MIDERKEKLIEDRDSFIFPYICEFPIVTKKVFLRFKRAIMIDIASSLLDELGFGREIEGKGSSDLFEITIIAPKLEDIQEIVYHIRQCCFKMPMPDERYENLVPSLLLRHFAVGRGKMMGIMGINGNLVGRVIQ